MQVAIETALKLVNIAVSVSGQVHLTDYSNPES